MTIDMTARREPKNPKTLPKAGDVVHCLKTGTAIPSSTPGFGATARTLTRGENVTITDFLIEATRNRLGVLGSIALAHDDDEQRARWGKPRFAMGPAPLDMEPWEPGSAEWAEARAHAQHAASRQLDPSTRARALADVNRRFGPPPPTSWAVERTGEGRDERLLREQQERNIDRGETYSVRSWTS